MPGPGHSNVAHVRPMPQLRLQGSRPPSTSAADPSVSSSELLKNPEQLYQMVNLNINGVQKKVMVPVSACSKPPTQQTAISTSTSTSTTSQWTNATTVQRLLAQKQLSSLNSSSQHDTGVSEKPETPLQKSLPGLSSLPPNTQVILMPDYSSGKPVTKAVIVQTPSSIQSTSTPTLSAQMIPSMPTLSAAPSDTTPSLTVASSLISTSSTTTTTANPGQVISGYLIGNQLVLTGNLSQTLSNVAPVTPETKTLASTRGIAQSAPLSMNKLPVQDAFDNNGGTGIRINSVYSLSSQQNRRRPQKNPEVIEIVPDSDEEETVTMHEKPPQQIIIPNFSNIPTQVASPIISSTVPVSTATSSSSVQVISPCIANSLRVISPSNASSVQVISPSNASSVQVISPSNASSVQVISPSIASSVQVISPSFASTVRMASPTFPNSAEIDSTMIGSSLLTASPSIASSVQVISPNIASSVQVISPNIASSVQVISPSIASSVQVISPSIASAVRMASPTTQNSGQIASTMIGSSLPTSSPSIASSLQVIRAVPISTSKQRTAKITASGNNMETRKDYSVKSEFPALSNLIAASPTTQTKEPATLVTPFSDAYRAANQNLVVTTSGKKLLSVVVKPDKQDKSPKQISLLSPFHTTSMLHGPEMSLTPECLLKQTARKSTAKPPRRKRGIYRVTLKCGPKGKLITFCSSKKLMKYFPYLKQCSVKLKDCHFTDNRTTFKMMDIPETDHDYSKKSSSDVLTTSGVSILPAPLAALPDCIRTPTFADSSHLSKVNVPTAQALMKGPSQAIKGATLQAARKGQVYNTQGRNVMVTPTGNRTVLQPTSVPGQEKGKFLMIKTNAGTFLVPVNSSDGKLSVPDGSSQTDSVSNSDLKVLSPVASPPSVPAETGIAGTAKSDRSVDVSQSSSLLNVKSINRASLSPAKATDQTIEVNQTMGDSTKEVEPKKKKMKSNSIQEQTENPNPIHAQNVGVAASVSSQAPVKESASERIRKLKERLQKQTQEAAQAKTVIEESKTRMQTFDMN